MAVDRPTNLNWVGYQTIGNLPSYTHLIDFIDESVVILKLYKTGKVERMKNFGRVKQTAMNDCAVLSSAGYFTF